MKVIGYIFLYILLTGMWYLTISLLGTFFVSYVDIITNPNWFVAYLLIFHWWLVIFSLMEYWNKYIRDLNL